MYHKEIVSHQICYLTLATAAPFAIHYLVLILGHVKLKDDKPEHHRVHEDARHGP